VLAVHVGFNRLRDNEDLRFNRWDGQSTDGKKHDRPDDPAFPWDGASDTRVTLIDSIIAERVDLKKNAFNRSIALLKGMEPKDVELAAHATKLLEWLTQQKMNEELAKEVELTAQWQDMYGNFVLHPTWEREIGLKNDRVTLQKLAEATMQNPESPLAMLTQLIASEDTEDQAIALVQEFGKQIAQSMAIAQLNGDQSDFFENYKVTAKRARRFVRELREGKQSSLPIPYICKNQPKIKALKLWDDVFVPAYVTDLQKSPYIFVKDYYTEQELRARAAAEDWNQDWVDKAITQKGKKSTWTLNSSTETSVVFVNSVSDFTWLEPDETHDEEIEVIWAYTRQLDEDDVPAIYYTIFHAAIATADNSKDPLYAKNDMLGYAHKKMPFIPGPRESWHRSLLASRGIPEVLSSRQREMKVQRDAVVDATSMAVLPPINVYATAPGADYVFGPARRNTVLPNREPKFMEIPTRESVAMELFQQFSMEMKEEMGIPHPEIPPERTQVKQQAMVNAYLTPWTETFQQVLSLIKQYMPDETFMEITGSDQPLQRESIDFEKDFILTFDVRELSDEHMLKRSEAVAKGIMPYDREGVISPSKFVRFMLRSLDPALAKEITLDGNQANEQLRKRVSDDFIAMFAGNEPRLTPADNPTAQAELQIAEQLMQENMKYKQAMAQDPDFREKVQKWSDNRTFNISQKKNASTGRYGVAA